MSRYFYLSDQQWALIKPPLPQYKGGKPRVDDRRVISVIIHVLQSGFRWQDCPPEYGSYTTIYNRYHRWSANLSEAMLGELRASSSCPYVRLWLEADIHPHCDLRPLYPRKRTYPAVMS